MSAVVFSNVSKRFGAKPAVTDFSVHIESGSVVALLGPNGAGKTTSISMMLGLVRPSAGTVLVHGLNPTNPAAKQHIGAMLQQVGLPPQLSVREVIQLFRSSYANPLPVNQLLELAELSADAKRPAVKLSGGQKRRLQFALAMAGNPNILFLDEPTTAMDVASRRVFWDRLRTFAADKQKTIILTTHHLEEADAISDRIVLMQNGRKIADGAPHQIKSMAGFKYVSLLAGPGVTDAELSTLPGVSGLEWSGRHVRIRTKDSDRVLRALVHQNLDVSEYEISSGGLEDAFLALTSEGE